MKGSLQLLVQCTATHSNLTLNKCGDLDRKKYKDGQFPLEDEIQSTAICHMHYRKPDQLLATANTSLEMVMRGQAWMNASAMVILSNASKGNTSHNNEND